MFNLKTYRPFLYIKSRLIEMFKQLKGEECRYRETIKTILRTKLLSKNKFPDKKRLEQF